MCAKDVCFKEGHWISYFADACKVMPIDRNGATGGVWQPEMEAVLDKLRAGHWVHYFPEGRIRQVRRDRRTGPYAGASIRLSDEKCGVGECVSGGATTFLERPIGRARRPRLLPIPKRAHVLLWRLLLCPPGAGWRGTHVQTRRGPAGRSRA